MKKRTSAMARGLRNRRRRLWRYRALYEGKNMGALPKPEKHVGDVWADQE